MKCPSGVRRVERFVVVGIVTLLAVVSGPVFAADPATPPVFSMDDEVRASHILLRTEAEAAECQKEILEAGGTIDAFRAVCRAKSKDPTTKPLGGDLGYFNLRSGFDRAFAEAAFELKPMQMSDPVKSSFGWHLIYVTDRRARQRPAKPEPVAKTEPAPEAKAQPSDPSTAPATPATPAPAPERVDPKRVQVTAATSFRVSLMTLKTARSETTQFAYLPDQAMEVVVTVMNELAKDQQFLATQLLPLGLKVTPMGGVEAVKGDWSSVVKPDGFLATLKPYEVVGLSIDVDQYFKKLSMGRYRVGWDVRTLLTNLEAQFPAVKDVAEYAALAEALRKPGAVTMEAVVRDTYNRPTRYRELATSIFERLDPSKKYKATFKVAGLDKPIEIVLNTQSQFEAAQHFANLVLAGFYDGLGFFEVQPGDFLLAGCPLRTGTGAPSGPLPITRNKAKLEHKRGTISFVSRSVRQQAPIQGGQIGSIFMVCLKPHPEWDDEHVPFGEVVSDLSALDALPSGRMLNFLDVTLSVEGGPTATTPAAAKPQPQVSNPEVVIKTAKGDIAVELFEDVARNTAINFVRLALDGFYDKLSTGEGKQKFIYLMKDQAGKPLLLQAGSPTNDFDGNPGYFIRAEKNDKRCVRGSLVMATQADPATGKFVPDTAGSQFFICLSDIPAYEYDPALTVFGQVKSGLEVLDKLQEGDTIEKVEVTSKKTHSYTVSKIPLAGAAPPAPPAPGAPGATPVAPTQPPAGTTTPAVPPSE